MSKPLSWAEAIRLVAESKRAMTQAAADAIDRVPQTTWRRLLLAQLIADAKAMQRESALRAERAAERRNRRVSAQEWKKWSEQRNVEMGLRPDAEPEEMLMKAISNFKEAMRLEWTSELLSSRFALGDGTSVTWGEASLAQHKDRQLIFKEHAHLNLEGAARHQAAIDALTSSGAGCLNDMLEKAA